MLTFPIYLLLFLVFVNRYVGGYWMKKLRGKNFDTKVEGYEPIVTVVIPLYNEGEQIYHTIHSLLMQDYPEDKLTIMVVDDCSTDDSYTWARKAMKESPRVQVIQNPYNMGKRRGINNAVRHATSEIIVSVDSDVIVERDAVRHLVARFTRPSVAAVGGRVNVLNANENWLTRMQAIKYWFGYEYLKNLERAFSSVMCLSGCLTAYRRHVLIELEPILEHRHMFGVPIKYGEDRFLTRQIVKAGYETRMTLDAVSWTVAPNTLSKYFSQQLRWRRSNFVDLLGGMTHAYKLHPIVGIHYMSLFAMMLAYPVLIVTSIERESFLGLAGLHIGTLAALGTLYGWKTRKRPAAERVHPLWFIGMAVVMPVTYIVATPLAFFTLDSGSWETRVKPQAAPEPEAVPADAEATPEIAFMPAVPRPSLRPIQSFSFPPPPHGVNRG